MYVCASALVDKKNLSKVTLKNTHKLIEIISARRRHMYSSYKQTHTLLSTRCTMYSLSLSQS